MKLIFNLLLILFFTSCLSDIKKVPEDQLEGIEGKEQFKSTSYITAGDRVYAIGSQDGTFPEIGWHIKNEMGGVWNHPIKLLDGYNARITNGKNSEELNNAKFINYPFGNEFLYELKGLDLSVKQFQFSPDQHQGLIIEYLIANESDETFVGSLEFESSFDLRPTWLGERTGMMDGDDYIEYDLNKNQIVAKDRDNPWFSSLSSSEPITSFKHSENSYTGKGVAGISTIHLSIESRAVKRLQFYISGSYNSLNESLDELKIIQTSSDQLLNHKISKFKDIESYSKLTTSDPEFDQVFRWLKFNSDWFIREVPEIGRGIAAGYPDYPWWFGCDSEYALKGYLSIGAFDLVTSNINLLSSLSNKTNENGRIIHEASTNGSVFNPGNLNETPQFASLVWEAYKWTGNQSLLSENFSLIRRGLNWTLYETDMDENGFPEGAGMMEIHGLESEMIDVASYTQRGFQDASKIAAVLGDSILSAEYETLAKSLRRKINDSFWVEDFNSFADFIASDKQTLHLIDDAIVRADTLNKPWAVEELNLTKQYIIKNPSDSIRPFVLHHNWVVNTPMEMGIADSDKAQKALNTAEKFVNPYGVFVTGIDRDDSAGKDTGSFKGSKVFSYTGAVMTLPTGVSAISENNYGNPDKALDYLKRMGRSFSFALPGSIYEVSPDYGMFAQAWNLYSYAVPVVQQFFGINPDAAKNLITISPLMPSSWETAKLENVKVGNNKISLEYKKSSSGYSIAILSENENWNIIFEPKESEVIISKNRPTPAYTIYEVTTKL
jgi:glycogen debranching enzyme